MKTIAMSFQEAELWSAGYTGERDGIVYDGTHLLVPDELIDAVLAVEVTATGYLEAMKPRMLREIDEAAEAERLKYITPGAGQAMTYQQKMEEVRALAQDPDPSPANYPMLAAEIGLTAPTLAAVAAVILQAYQQWQQIGAAIEAVRLGAKAAISTAETMEAAEAVITALHWPSPEGAA